MVQETIFSLVGFINFEQVQHESCKTSENNITLKDFIMHTITKISEKYYEVNIPK